MKIATLLSVAFMLLPALAQSQFTPEDSLRAIEYDQNLLNTFFGTPETANLPTSEQITLLGEAIAKRQRNGPITVSLANNYHQIARGFKSDHPDLVKPLIDTAITLRIQAGALTVDIAQSHYEKGRILYLLGDFQNCLFFHEEALRIMDQAIDEEGLTPDLARRKAYFLKEAAFAARLNGNYELGRLRLAQIPPLVPIASRYEQTVFEATVTEAEIETLTGNFSRAIQLYENAVSLPYFTNAPVGDKASVQNGQGYVNMLAGKYSKAEVFFNTAAQGFRLMKNQASEASTLINLIQLNNLKNKPDAAEELRKRSELILSDFSGAKYGEIPGELYLYSAEAASQLNQHNRADTLFAKAAAALLENPLLLGPALLPRITGNAIYSQPVLLDMLTKKREAFRRRDQLENALETSRTIDTLLRYNREQLNLTASLGQFITREAEQYAEAINIALELHRSTGDKAYLNEAYRFASGQKSNLLRRYLTSPGLAASFGVPEDVVQEKSDLELKILTTERAFQNAPPAQTNALRDSLLRLNATVDQLKRKISKDYPAFSQALRGFPAIDPADAASTLEDDRMVVEFFLAQDTVYLFTLGKATGLEVFTVTRPANLAELIDSVVDQGEGATALYDLLLAPLLAGQDGITRLQLIPDGDLWRLPFGALFNGDRLLINDYAISFAYAAPLLFNQNLASRARAQTQKYLGYGISYQDLQSKLTNGGFRSADLNDLRGMGQLPFAVREVTNAANITGGTPRLDEIATLERFLEEAAGAKILHLSMHGLLRPNPMESALVFRGEDDGYQLLRMGDVLGGYYPAELTILSACHTGGGALQTSEGMQSIGRAFTAAGSRATITSTWAARDETTHDIITTFSAGIEAGKAKDVALQNAINTYLENASPADRAPKNWANLTLTGDVQPVDSEANWQWFLAGILTILALGGFFFWRRK